MPATAANIPTELYDNMLRFFRLIPDGKEDWISESNWEYSGDREGRNEWGRRNFVLTNKRELGWLALVCRRWARLCQPRIFQEVTLRNRNDVENLLVLLSDPKSRIAHHIKKVELSQSVATPHLPWIHIVVVQLIPKLPLVRKIDSTTLTGPLPAGQSLSSIHGILPTRYPFFATGICLLVLKDLHLKSFRNLVQLLKELPALIRVECKTITWDSSPDAPLPVATSYVGRDTDKMIQYRMAGCTDNAAAGWLIWTLALKLSGRLEQQDSDALCHIASALTKNIDAGRFPDWEVVSNRREDDLNFWAQSMNGNRLTPLVSVYLTSAVPGERTRRRVRTIRLWFLNLEVSSMVGWDCWSAIDAQLAILFPLPTVLIASGSHDDLVIFARGVVTQKMPALRDSDKLKYAYRTENYAWVWYTHATVDSKGAPPNLDISVAVGSSIIGDLDNGQLVGYIYDIL